MYCGSPCTYKKRNAPREARVAQSLRSKARASQVVDAIPSSGDVTSCRMYGKGLIPNALTLTDES